MRIRSSRRAAISRLFRAPWVALLAITLFGGILRFSFLSRPPIWSDEAMTHARVCGSYQDLIDVLQFNGFVPLHYELYWWISKGMPLDARIEMQPVRPIQNSRFGFFPNLRARTPPATTQSVKLKRTLVESHPIVSGGIRMTPFVMRFIPALCGTLMAPAMYFLTIQIASRRTALLAALLTACSAYLLNYSRDAKMYMDLWLMCTLNVACLLWWIRARTRVAWLCWVASGLAMCGLHAPGMILLAIELILFLTFDRQWWPTALILLGGLVLGGLIFGKTTIFSRSYDASWNVIGGALIVGITYYIARRGYHNWRPAAFFLLGLAIILAGPLGYYGTFNHCADRVDEYGWQESGLQWIDSYNRGRDGIDLVRYASTAFLTSWEWPRSLDERFIDTRLLRLLHGAIYVMTTLLILGLFPWRKVRLRQSPVTFAWLLAWLVLPTYATYCISVAQTGKRNIEGFVPNFASPLDWLNPPWVAIIVLVLLSIAFFFSDQSWRKRLNNVIAAVIAAACVFTMCLAVYLHLRAANVHAILNGDRWHSIWMPRYLGIAWPAMAIIVSVLLLRLPTRPLRALAIGFFVAVNLALFGARVFASSEPPADRIAADVSETFSPGNKAFRAYTNITDNFGMAPGMGAMFTPPWRYYMVLFANITTTPMELRTFRGGSFDRPFARYADVRPSAIEYDLKHNPQINRIVVWDRIDSYRPDAYANDPLKSLLAQNWRKVSEQIYPARDHWTWEELFRCRRREYVKTNAN